MHTQFKFNARKQKGKKYLILFNLKNILLVNNRGLQPLAKDLGKLYDFLIKPARGREEGE